MLEGQNNIRIVTTVEYDRWYNRLRDGRAKRRINIRIERLRNGNPGDVAPVGGGVSELRIHYAQGYRIYFTRLGTTVIVLLVCGDKSSQAEDIRNARAIARDVDEWEDL